MRKILIIAVAAAALTGLGACGGGGKSMSDGDARKVLGRELNEGAVRKIMIGDSVVTNGANDFAKREMSAEEFKEVQAWSQLGLVTVQSTDITYANRGNLPYSVQKTVKVTPTEAGLKLSKQAKVEKPEADKFLYGRFYDPKVKSVIENREVKKDVNLYRVVKGTVENRYSALGERFNLITGAKGVPEVKVVALLKYDSFDKDWELAALDAAEPDKEFGSNRVASALGQN